MNQRKVHNCDHYARIIAKEKGLPIWKVRAVLIMAWVAACRAMYLGEEVRLKKFGRIYFTKNHNDGTAEQESAASGTGASRDERIALPREDDRRRAPYLDE